MVCFREKCLEEKMSGIKFSSGNHEEKKLFWFILTKNDLFWLKFTMAATVIIWEFIKIKHIFRMGFSLFSPERSKIKQKLFFLCSIIDIFTNPSGGILNSCLISTKLYRCYFFTPMFHIFVKQRAQIISREAHHPNT